MKSSQHNLRDDTSNDLRFMRLEIDIHLEKLSLGAQGDDIKYLLKGIKKLKKVWNAFPFCEPKLYNNSLTSSCKIRVLDEEYH